MKRLLVLVVTALLAAVLLAPPVQARHTTGHRLKTLERQTNALRQRTASLQRQVRRINRNLGSVEVFTVCFVTLLWNRDIDLGYEGEYLDESVCDLLETAGTRSLNATGHESVLRAYSARLLRIR